MLGNIYHKLGNHNNAFYYYEQAAFLQEKIKDYQGIAITNGHIGRLFYSEIDFDKAIYYYSKDLEISVQHKNLKGRILMLYHIGDAYLQKHDLDKAEEYYIDFFTLSKKSGSNIDKIISASCLAECASRKGNLKKAEILFDEAESLLSTIKYQPAVAVFNYKKAGFLLNVKKFIAARKHIDRAIIIFERYSFRKELSDSLIRKAYICKFTNKAESAMLCLRAFEFIVKNPVRSIDKNFRFNIYKYILSVTCFLFDAISAALYFNGYDGKTFYVYRKTRDSMAKFFYNEITVDNKFEAVIHKYKDKIYLIDNVELKNKIADYINEISVEDLSFDNKNMLFVPLRKIEEELGGLIISNNSAIDIFNNESLLLMNTYIDFVESLNRYEMSFFDGLTGLMQRKNFETYLKYEFIRSKRYKKIFSVVMIDIDHFKNFNDKFGHHAGDIVLKKVSSEIKNLIRESDTAGRYGGEEIVLLLPEMDENHISVFLERCRINVENISFIEAGIQAQVTISLGSSTFSIEKNNVLPEILLKQADKMLYKAKNAGRNKAFSYNFETKTQ